MKPKKSLGQNFLKSPLITNTLCKTGNLNNDDIILEIGPGKGILTQKLLEKSKKVIAVEKDIELFNFLKNKFNSEKLELIHGDILNYNPPKKYKIIANIPYNITGAILRKFLSSENQPEKIVLLVQKEIANRICSKDKESILSLSIKAYGTPKYIMKVSRKFFSPSPKVDSAVISINNISRNNFKDKEEEEEFFKLIKKGFCHKRKILINNLKIDSEKLEALGINKKIRPEKLTLQKWLKLNQNMI
ncbi:MAG: 16S rRNA (adenine(1518)-N(6)/adenine(1519)-N(6))-dimethyltransferase RsmA [Patescibacteria group bacterium]|nr:16S rRNA (adenine(1518)-N(6)/adenine(1519)-N(6))-dimethyltransferase RsmA [Patescibacteria group bacterium]